MGKSLSVILVTKVLLVATLFYNQLPHCSAQDYIGEYFIITPLPENILGIISVKILGNLLRLNVYLFQRKSQSNPMTSYQI